MYSFIFTDNWLRKYKKLTSKNFVLKKKIKSKLQKLANDPRHPSLGTHKVETTKHGQCWSSSLTGDLRAVWNYTEDREALIVLQDLGGHSGKSKVYK